MDPLGKMGSFRLSPPTIGPLNLDAHAFGYFA